MTKKESLLKIKELIADFERNKEYHLSKEFLENHCEEQFVKPFLRALGWDLESRGIAPYLREVITQDRVSNRKTKRAPDYGFRLPGSDSRLFFLEAKGAFVKLKTDKDAAQQARWYGRAGKTPVSLLFNFAELAIYDCTQKQSATSDAKFARIKYFTLDEYEANFDFIYDTFSREAIYNGNFQSFIKDKTQKKGNVTLDKDFVESLEKWRLKLAKSIAGLNYKLDNDELNHAVQLLLDRIIFLRFCEERDVEPFGQLQAIAQHAHIYKHLLDLFYDADEKYNSGLFHFQDGCITQKLKVEDKVLRDIIEDLYPPKSDYSFYLMPVEILGNAYEQFLGKVIRITAGHNVKIELKPEVRKAGGVYYTPQYIVDYIVENTVGKLIEGKTPKDIEKIKIVDPACGSGSFLLGAYKYLINYHQNYYYNKKANSQVINADGSLTTAEKRKILTNNIFGVDLDKNAVEVSKLSLLLKCMEGETAATVKQQISLHHTRVLPDLDKNIVNGNSLIGFDISDDELELDKEAIIELENKVKPFDWKVTFPQVFKQGGFDAVIGNPPWVDLKGFPVEQINYFFAKYSTANNRINLYSLFIEKSLNIINSKGKFSFIIPNSMLYQSTYEALRKKILNDWNIEKLIRLPDNVFQDVKAETLIISLGREKCKIETLIFDRDAKINLITVKNTAVAKKITQETFLKNDLCVFDIFSDETKKKLTLKIETNSVPLETLCDFCLGITPYDKYKGHSESQIKNRVYHSTTKKDNTFKKLLEGADVQRYFVKWGGNEYISYGNWLGAPRDQKFFKLPRILVRQIISGKPPRIYAAYTKEELYNTQSVFSVILKNKIELNLLFILGLLNSSLINFYHSDKFLDKSKNLFQKILIQNCKLLPIRNFSLKEKKQKKLYDQIILIVTELEILSSDSQRENIDQNKANLTNRIQYNENKLNELVYELYELSPEEIQIIETAHESH